MPCPRHQLRGFPPISGEPRRPCGTPRPVSSRRGLTIVELVITMFIVSVATMMYSSTVVALSKQRVINRENSLAASAAKSIIETMRASDFRQVFALYNSDPSDDPGGAGTAPGAFFEVAGLDPQDGAPGGMVGEVSFPAVDVGGGGVPDLELRENVAAAEFGLPRDLSGDSIIDGADHSTDYLILPVLVRLRWTGSTGDRQFRVLATLCDYNWL